MRVEKLYCDFCGADMTDKLFAKIRIPMQDKNSGKPRLKEIEICYDCGDKLARKIEEYILRGTK